MRSEESRGIQQQQDQEKLTAALRAELIAVLWLVPAVAKFIEHPGATIESLPTQDQGLISLYLHLTSITSDTPLEQYTRRTLTMISDLSQSMMAVQATDALAGRPSGIVPRFIGLLTDCWERNSTDNQSDASASLVSTNLDSGSRGSGTSHTANIDEKYNSIQANLKSLKSRTCRFFSSRYQHPDRPAQLQLLEDLDNSDCSLRYKRCLYIVMKDNIEREHKYNLSYLLMLIKQELKPDHPYANTGLAHPDAALKLIGSDNGSELNAAKRILAENEDNYDWGDLVNNTWLQKQSVILKGVSHSVECS